MTSILKVDEVQNTAGNSILKVDEIQDAAGKKILQNTGSILQVRSRQMDGRDSITSSSFTATSFSHTITPTSTSSKVLVVFMTGLNTQASGRDGQLTVYRDSTELSGETHGLTYIKGDSSRIQIPVHLTVLDSPATTSSVTYKLYAKSSSGGNIEVPVTSSESTTITLIEVSA